MPIEVLPTPEDLQGKESALSDSETAANREVFEYAFLYLGKSVMVAVQDFLRGFMLLLSLVVLFTAL